MVTSPQHPRRNETPEHAGGSTPSHAGARFEETVPATPPADSGAAGANASSSTGSSAAAAAEEQSERAGRMAHIPALDGIRTLAVAAVVLYHLSPNLAPGGMQGVTVFFVLSGYLITRLLLTEHEGTGRIDLKGFWQRRLRRLIPAIVTVIVASAALCTLFNHVMLTKMRPDIIPSALFLNNWWQIFNQQSYFNAVGDPSPLTHFWSLAIEMQFYLVWPVALMLALRGGQPERRIGRAALALAAVSAIEMAILYNPGADPSRIYYGTDTRAFSLLLGAWLAFVPNARLTQIAQGAWRAAANKLDRKAPRHLGAGPLDALGTLGLAGLLLLIVFSNGYTAFPYRGGILLASVFTLMVIAACTQAHSRLAKLFSAKPLVWLGQRSYSIYLWHYPLLLLMNPASDVSSKPWWVYLCQVAIVIGVSELCYRFIETPFRRGAAGRILSQLRDKEALPAWIRVKAIPLTLAGSVALVALGGVVLVPATSALSEDGAALLQGSNGGGESDGDTEDKATQDGAGDSGDAIPEGAYDITMVGDSVSLRAVETFMQMFPHGHIDAAMNRQFTAGTDVYRGLVDQGLAGRIAVFALGTNGPFSAQDVDALMELAGDKRIVVFVNNRAARPWCEPNNRVLSEAAERYDNVILIDWFAYSANRNDLFDGDGIHLSNAGAAEYVQLIDDQVARYLPIHLEDGGDERLMVAQRVLDSVKAGCRLDLEPIEVEGDAK